MTLPYDPSLLYSMGLQNSAGLSNNVPLNYNRYRNFHPHQNFPHQHGIGGLQPRSGSIGSGNVGGGVIPHSSNSLSHILDSFFDPQNKLKIRDHAAKVEIAENGDFTYKLDVSGFDAEEINVAVEGENIVVRGEHKSETPDEAVERTFMRRVRIPRDILKETITCTVNESGFLTIVAKNSGGSTPEVRQIPVQFKPASSVTSPEPMSRDGTPKFSIAESPKNSSASLAK